MKPPSAIGSVPSLSGHAIAYRWRSLPRVRQHRASKPQGSSERVLPWQVTMDQLIFASLSHTHYWYEVGMLKVPCTASRWVSPRYYTVDPMLLPSGNPFKCHQEILYLQPLIPPKRFDISPPDWGMLGRSRCVQIFLLKNRAISIKHKERYDIITDEEWYILVKV